MRDRSRISANSVSVIGDLRPEMAAIAFGLQGEIDRKEQTPWRFWIA
ncbi:MAG: hypothetical protein J7647_18540 [Cyanobacteria bacterium SBLK]|nr:hypothetical protein [Cyanobacteria bacterium SBLK]